MNKLKITFYTLITALILPFSACKDEALNPVPDWESGIHGNGQFSAGSAQNFVFAEPDQDIDVEFQWVSIDNLNTVTEIEFYILFNESYADNDGNPRTARHGGTEGKLFKKLTGAEVKANREFVNLTITQADVYDLYKDNTFDYGNGVVNVFANPAKPDRGPGSYLVAGDAFQLRWAMRTADGRYFDSWSPSVCSEFPNASCAIDWAIICVSELDGTFNYVQTEMMTGSGGGVCDAEIIGTVTWTEESPGKYITTDLSFGMFPSSCWSDDPANSPNARILDQCNTIIVGGGDQYGDTYTYQFISFNGPSLTLKWNNTYGDKGTVVLTRQDGRDWPVLKGG